MVLSRRLEYGLNGYQAPTMPRAARSARRRSLVRKNLEGNKLCAFDLLATLAGGNLLVGKSSSSSTSKSPPQKNDRAIINLNGKEGSPEHSDHSAPQQCERISCDEEVIDSQAIPPEHDEAKSNPSVMELPASAGDGPIELTEAADTKDQSERLGVDMLSCEQGNAMSIRVGAFVGDGPSAIPKSEDESCNSDRALYNSGADVYSLKDHVVCDKKPLVLHSSSNNSQVPPCGHKDKVSHSSFPVENDLVVVSRDDDENSSGCTHPSSYKKPFRLVHYIGYRRIRKVSASQSCKEIPRYKNKFKRFAVPCHTNCRDNDSWDNHQKFLSQRNFPFKKRRFYDTECQSFSDKETNGNGKAAYPGRS